VPEVVEQGITGFICNDEDELTAATKLLDEIDRARCRRAAERRFSAPTMAGAYERVYQELVDDDAGPLASALQFAAPNDQVARVGAI
jgi:glycosyltransferase involved in cell wall biosynthesis